MSKPTMVDEDNDYKTIFWSCPIKFVPDSIWEFVKMYSFYQNHPSSPFPKYENISPRYLKAEQIFNSELLRNRE
jgi:hypothetical protein